ncbi:type I secretion system permease/ATPase [Thioclava pacifica]|uniref:Type I secretion system permease/ATPase n=1 Tax=Thioclava pacifica DSM 10166 TaxID=1353537 RepID=A0A074J3T4_9RHOB|nr:type I secretion system permease/ATPase [Thioclava pacifica]KEO51149.1 hypothetical protein TP2_12180 [Thioclava pacifica DSM 10166]
MKKATALGVVLKSVRGQMWSLLWLSFLGNLLLLTSSIYMMQIFDRVLSSGSVDTLTWLSVIAAAALVAFGLLELSRRQVLSRIGVWFERELSGEVMSRALSQRLKEGKSVADVSDLADVRSFISGEALLAFLDAPWTPVFIAVIWFMHPVLGGIAIGAALLLFALAVINDILTRRPLAEMSSRMRRNRSDASVFIEHADTLEALGMVGKTTERWKASMQKLDAEGEGAQNLAAFLLSASKTLRMIIQIVILGTGAYLVLQAELTAGGMIAASIILSRALAPVERALSAWRSYGSYRAARRNLEQLFAAVPERGERLELPRPSGELEVSALRYHAPTTGEPILKNISMRVPAGKTLAIIGPSGSGKSSLCRCLVGAWQPTFGTVRLDGADLAEWDSDRRGRYIGYLPQAIRLFSGTIAENIARLGEIDDEAVLAAAQRVGAHEMILGLPEGYETETGPFSDLLSGGQKQRIGMARALYGNPSVIALDEPDSNLDGNGDLALASMLKDLKAEERTVIFVSHTPALLRYADMVAVLKDGVLVQMGTRDEVLSSMMKTGTVGTAQKAVGANG